MGGGGKGGVAGKCLSPYAKIFKNRVREFFCFKWSLKPPITYSCVLMRLCFVNLRNLSSLKLYFCLQDQNQAEVAGETG